MDFINQRSLTLSSARTITAKESIIVLSHQEIEGYPKSPLTHYLPYGDFQKLTVTMAQTFGDLAAVVVVPPLYESSLHTGEMRRIRQLANAEGALMIWDELIKDSETEKMRTMIKPDIYLASNKLNEVNFYETEFVQQEIFTNKTYLKHGLEINNDSVIVDIGANIGLFTLFAKSIAPLCQIFAFEPAKEVFEKLQKNTQRFTSGIKLFNQGVSNFTGEDTFTYYPGYSVISGFHTDLAADKAVILAGEKFKSNPAADEVISSRFDRQQSYVCPVISLSDLIKREGLTKIDFLKVDAEKSELLILEQLNFEDWAKIRQIVVEVHGTENQQRLLSKLEMHGFTTHCELGLQTTQESIYTLYGSK